MIEFLLLRTVKWYYLLIVLALIYFLLLSISKIIVIDDNSSDRTYQIIKEYERKYSRIKVLRGKELAAGWYGKAQAMQQLAAQATGEYYFFTDADTVHQRQSISWAVSNALHHNTDFLSAYPYHEMSSFGERLIVPCIYILTALFLPLWLIPGTKNAAFSHAIGQVILFKEDTFHAIGGYSSVRSQISEDVHIGRRVKELGYKTIFLNSKDYVTCRMYTGYTEAVNGISKNIYDYFNKKLFFLLCATVIVAGFIILPFFFFLCI